MSTTSTWWRAAGCPRCIYYATVATSVYLLAVHHRAHMVVDLRAERLGWRDRVNLGAFVFVVGGLVALMASIHLAPMFAALYMFCAAGAALFLINLRRSCGLGAGRGANSGRRCAASSTPTLTWWSTSHCCSRRCRS